MTSLLLWREISEIAAATRVDPPVVICFFILYLLAVVADSGGNNNLDVRPSSAGSYKSSPNALQEIVSGGKCQRKSNSREKSMKIKVLKDSRVDVKTPTLRIKKYGQRDLLIGNDWERKDPAPLVATTLLARVSHMFALIFSTSDVDQTDIIQRLGPKLCVLTRNELVPRAIQRSGARDENWDHIISTMTILLAKAEYVCVLHVCIQHGAKSSSHASC
ncbi:hypothetical protein AKJ16_DCAP16560 [Drosera capensis]